MHEKDWSAGARQIFMRPDERGEKGGFAAYHARNGNCQLINADFQGYTQTTWCVCQLITAFFSARLVRRVHGHGDCRARLLQRAVNLACETSEMG